jgi:hypothetical protein
MREHPTYRGEEIVNLQTHHEKSDVNVKALLWAGVIFIVFSIVTYVLLYLQFKALAQLMRGSTNAPVTAVAKPPGSDMPAEPRLQPFPTRANQSGAVPPPNTTTPVTDMEEMRRAQDQALNSVGWVDRQKGIVRIPIGTAKALAVERLASASRIDDAANGGSGGLKPAAPLAAPPHGAKP